jgi:tetratricopeptide (TPR) repeat protein
MKKRNIIFVLLSLVALAGWAQPKFASKVMKGIVSVNTYDKQGALLRQGTGFYIGANGEAVANYKLFRDAYKAVVVDASGKQLPVDCILGADDTYSMARFQVNTKGNVALSRVGKNVPLNARVYILKGSTSDAMQSEQAVVSDTSMIQGKYVYYGLDKKVNDQLLGSPVFDEAGQLMGILHSTIGGRSYVLDIRFSEELKMAAIPNSSASIALSGTFIPKGLPETAEEALVYLYLRSKSASNEEYIDITNRFVATFPKNAEGYLRRATPLIDLLRFDEAEDDMQKYLTLVEDKASGNFNVASLIYDKLRLQPEPAYDKWSYDVAIEYLDKAISLNASKPATDDQKAEGIKYQILKAQMLVAKKDYDAAIQLYESLNQGEGKSLAYLFAISLAKEGRGDSLSAVIEPLDSAISMMGEPLPQEAANYVIRRGQLLANGGKYREAVQDYNQYAYLMNNKVSAVFYYERSQIEVNARMFQQALDDINKALEMAPSNPLYHIERAAQTLRVNMIDECIQSCQTAIQINPSIIDSYRILGYAQLQKGEKEKARLNLQKAADLGDEGAKKILEMYFK